MSVAKLQTARELIKEGNRTLAREVLLTVEGDEKARAQEWLSKLGTASAKPKAQNNEVRIKLLEDEIKKAENQKNSATIVFIGSLLLTPLGVGIVLAPLALINYFRYKGNTEKLQAERKQLLVG